MRAAAGESLYEIPLLPISCHLMNINLIPTLLVYAVSLHRGLKNGGHLM